MQTASRQQAVPPPFEKPFDGATSNMDVLMEIANKAGFLDAHYEQLNTAYSLKEP